MKKCKNCLEEKSLECFESTLRKDKLYIRSFCKKCKNKIDYNKTKISGRYEKRKLKNRMQRHDPRFRARFILSDCKLSDKKFGLENDLDINFIKNKIKDGCYYCNNIGSDIMKIGIDRIDNSIGHIKNNVNACCSRCNFIRGNMPYDAWMVLVPSIKYATSLGLFNDWVYGFKHHTLTK